jgi:hypothetical protein
VIFTSLVILALAGTWTLNVAKSHSSQPLPSSRTLIISRTATGYLMRQIEGIDTTAVTISLTGTGPSAALNDGASAIRYTARAAGDTIVYVEDLTVDNQGLAGTKSGRLFLSDGGKVLTDLSEQVTNGETVDEQLVFDRK